MTIQEFKKVARLLKEAYAELEKEALAEGIDIFSDEYLKVRDMVRLKVLERMGFTLDEYREAKEQVAPAKKVDVAKQVMEASTIAQDVSNRVEALKIPDEDQLMQKMHELAESVVKPPVIQNNIVERTTIEKPTIVKESVTKIVNREADLNPLYAEIGYLNDRLDNLPEIPESLDPDELIEKVRSEFQENLEKNINTLGMPDFRKLAMGLQTQIDDIRMASGTSSSAGVSIVASDPVSPTEGDMIVNTSTNEMKIYYGGTWQVLHTLVPSSGTGIGYWIIGTDFVIS